MLKEYHHHEQNIGDTLTPVILDWLRIPHQRAEKAHSGKFLGVGSILGVAKENDIVWGSGLIKDMPFKKPEGLKVLALRGKLTEKILDIDCGIYGDPALLLPLIYNPDIKPTKLIGYCPHYIHHDLFKKIEFINVRQNWKDFIDDLLQYEKIVTSSLHGFIIALAYGREARWAKYDDRVIGDGFKFRDFGSGIGLDIKEDVWYNKIENLAEIQNKLINVLKNYYETTRNQS
jgi:pyruvyltransferase